MKNKNIDYHAYYQHNYKNLPNVAFWATAITFWLAGISFFVIFGFGNYNWGGAVLSLCAGAILGVLFGYLNKNWCATIISQKVVVADTLLEMNKHGDGSEATIEDELPEL